MNDFRVIGFCKQTERLFATDYLFYYTWFITLGGLDLMNKKLSKIRLAALLVAALMIYSASGISAFAAGSRSNSSPAFYSEGEGDGESTTQSSSSTQSNSTTTSTTAAQGGQDETAELVEKYSERVNKALDEMESHARALLTAANAGDSKKFNSELQAYNEAENKVTQELGSNSGVPSKDALEVANKAKQRIDQIKKIRSQADTALANSLGGAQDENGNHYRLAKVTASVSKAGTTSDEYKSAIAALGANYREGDICAVYKVSLKVGSTPVRLIGGTTKSVTISYSNDISGTSPVSYYIDYKNGAPAAVKRGSLNKWNVVVKASEPVSYYVVCVIPFKGGNNANKNNGTYTYIPPTNDGTDVSTELSEKILTAFRVADSSDDAQKALRKVDVRDKKAAVYRAELPEGEELAPETEAIVNVSCPEAANGAVEISRVTDEDYVWLGTFMADSEGKLQFQTTELGVFVLSWIEEVEEEPEETSSADEIQAQESVSAPIWPWILAAIAGTVAIVFGAQFIISRFFSKKD